MSFIKKLKESGRLQNALGCTIWKYGLSENDFLELKSDLQNAYSFDIDSRDAFIYYAEWWKNEYHGGKPSKRMIFESIGGPLQQRIDEERFYKLAKNGARRLGIKWVTKQNTLYFRTMLMQGGLPLKHISENYSHYLNFLMAVLEVQPEAIEDFAFNGEIIGILPKSSQNDIIYENCFEIVRSILKGESIYDDLLKSNAAVNKISQKLKERSLTLQRRTREIKPKNYWLLSKKNEKYNIELRVGLADSYSEDGLSNIFGFDLEDNEYQFFLNDEMLCIFRKMLNGRYKTDWYGHNALIWDGSDAIPNTYVLVGGIKHQVHDFIQLTPNLQKPSLWVPYSDDVWRLIKGTGTSQNNASLLFPDGWNTDVLGDNLELLRQKLNFVEFEGEIFIQKDEEVVSYRCSVSSFDWTILCDKDKPKWMRRSNMPIVRGIPQVFVYDESGKRISSHDCEIFLKKHGKLDEWINISAVKNIEVGCYDVKINYNGLTAFDNFYNIAHLNIRYNHVSLSQGEFIVEGTRCEFILEKSNDFKVDQNGSSFRLSRSVESKRIPPVINARLKDGSYKSVRFELESPLQGIAIVNQEGDTLHEYDILKLQGLSGLRILSNQGLETTITLQNKLKKEVTIRKILKTSFHPLSSFRDDLIRLFYLSDAMDFQNKVEIIISNKFETKCYEIALFSRFLNVDQQLERIVKIELDQGKTKDVELAAIPLNVCADNLDILPLTQEENQYKIPKFEFTSDFIIVSSGDSFGDVMPRYVRTDEHIQIENRHERIVKYHAELFDNSFDHEAWRQLIKYFELCKNLNIPFSTLDQLRSLVGSSRVAARAFLVFGQKAEDKNDFIQSVLPRLEQELGFNFHWISRTDWHESMDELVSYSVSQDWFVQLMSLNLISEDHIFMELFELIRGLFQNSNLDTAFSFLSNQRIQSDQSVDNQQIQSLRGHLGAKVLEQLPKYSPHIKSNYGIPVDQHAPVKLLVKTPIAVAESIADIEKNLTFWSYSDFTDGLRRNMQYAQYLTPEFYNKVLTYTLKKLS